MCTTAPKRSKGETEMVRKEKLSPGGTEAKVAADATTTAVEAKAQVQELKKKIAVEAEKIVHEKMPLKVKLFSCFERCKNCVLTKGLRFSSSRRC